MTRPARLLVYVLPCLVAAAIVSPLPGTAGLHWLGEIIGWAAVLVCVYFWVHPDPFSNGNVGSEK